MSKANEPAFPVDGAVFGGEVDGVRTYLNPTGLTKREYLAAMAMQGILADAAIELAPESLARCAVRNADALIAELEKKD